VTSASSIFMIFFCALVLNDDLLVCCLGSTTLEPSCTGLFGGSGSCVPLAHARLLIFFVITKASINDRPRASLEVHCVLGWVGQHHP
jgi:hypothetical protein